MATAKPTAALLAAFVLLITAPGAEALKIYTDPDGKTPTVNTQDVVNRLRVQIGGTATVNWGDCGGPTYCIDDRMHVTLKAGMPRNVARKAIASVVGEMFARWYIQSDDDWGQLRVDSGADAVDAFQVCARSNPRASGGRWINQYGPLARFGKRELRTFGPASCAAIRALIERGPNPADPPAAHACEQIQHGVYRLCGGNRYTPAW